MMRNDNLLRGSRVLSGIFPSLLPFFVSVVTVRVDETGKSLLLQNQNTTENHYKEIKLQGWNLHDEKETQNKTNDFSIVGLLRGSEMWNRCGIWSVFMVCRSWRHTWPFQQEPSISTSGGFTTPSLLTSSFTAVAPLHLLLTSVLELWDEHHENNIWTHRRVNLVSQRNYLVLLKSTLRMTRLLPCWHWVWSCYLHVNMMKRNNLFCLSCRYIQTENFPLGDG